MKNALLSVTDKTQLLDLARGLTKLGWNLYATSGTLKALKEDPSIVVESVDTITKTPEMLDGRVKTLNPRIFAGILARRDEPGDLKQLEEMNIPLFDLVVVNLYKFEEHLEKPREEQAAFIDIGGPSLIRAAAKNSKSVCVLINPDDYKPALSELKSQGRFSSSFKSEMAGKAFLLTSTYDAMIANAWASVKSTNHSTTLRYGENPHQAGFYAPPNVQNWTVIQGKELSYNNLLDADSAIRLAMDFSIPSVAVIKHTNPCGVAALELPLERLFENAVQCDAQSAFGGIVGTNRIIDSAAARAMIALFLEVIIAPEFTKEAKQILSEKKNLRLIEWLVPTWPDQECRSAMGGLLIQPPDKELGLSNLKTVTKLKVSDSLWNDLKLAWIVAKHAKSNAIVIARNSMTIGVGAGQMSRVDSVELALKKAAPKGTVGAVLASDAFFPFRDNIDKLKGSGIAAIIQPGGSMRDAEVIAACDELGIAMVFTGMRHFRH